MKRLHWDDPHIRFPYNTVLEVAEGMLEGKYHSIIGPPFSGKTIFLRQVEELIKSRIRLATIFINIFDLLDLSRQDFYMSLLGTIKEALHLGEITESEKVEPLDAISEISSKMRKKLFIFMANVDYLDDNLAKSILLSFRAISEAGRYRKNNVIVAVSGSRNLLEWTIGRTSPFNIALPFEMIPLDIDGIKKYLALATKEEYPLEASSIEYLYEITFGNPFLISKISRHVIRQGACVNTRELCNAVNELFDNYVPTAYYGGGKAEDNYDSKKYIDIYRDFINDRIERESESFSLLCYLLKRTESKDFEYETAKLGGIARKTEDGNFKFANPIVEKSLRERYHPVRLAHVAVRFGMWEWALGLLKSISTSERVRLTGEIICDNKDEMLETIRAFEGIFVGLTDDFGIRRTFLEGIEFLLNVKKCIIYGISEDGKDLVPDLYHGFDKQCPETVRIDIMDDNMACCCYDRNRLSMSTDCNYLAAPIGMERSRPVEIIYCSMNYSRVIDRFARIEINIEISRLGRIVHMALSNAKHLRKINDSLSERFTPDMTIVAEKNEMLGLIMRRLQQKADLDKKLYFILTALTIKHSLEFNRAVLFLIDQESLIIRGHMAVGSINFAEHKKNADDPFFDNTVEAIKYLWEKFDSDRQGFIENPFSKIIRDIDIEKSFLIKDILNGRRVRTLDQNVISENMRDPFVKKLITSGIMHSRLAVFPLVTEGNQVGIICVDNRWDDKPFDNINLLFAHFISAQAALLIRQEGVAQRESELENIARVFIGYASHELKTPIHTVLAIIERLKEKSYTGEDLKILESEAERIKFSATTLLNFATIQKGISICGRTERVQVKKIEEFIDLIVNIPGFKKSHNVVVENTFGPAEIKVSSDCIKSLLRNILNNSIRHCQNGSSIRVIIRRMDEHIVFMIEDNGPGISSDLLASLMLDDEPNIEIMDGRSRPRLGLKICKHIVGELSGTLKIGNVPGPNKRAGLFINISVPHNMEP